jgi:hypothetical protein
LHQENSYTFLHIVFDILESKRVESNKEWFISAEEDAEDFIKIIEECKKVNC